MLFRNAKHVLASRVFDLYGLTPEEREIVTNN